MPDQAQTTARTYGRGARIYTDSEGYRYPSVTTRLQGVPKPALTGWAAKSVAQAAVDNHAIVGGMIKAGQTEQAVSYLKEAPWSYAEKRADIGKEVHAAAEAWMLKRPWPEWPPEVAPYMEQIADCFEQLAIEPQAVEITVYNRSHAYAGTADLVARVRVDRLNPGLLREVTGQGGVWEELAVASRSRDYLDLILDHKTGKDVYPEAALQLAAYRHGEFIELQDKSRHGLPKIDAAAVLHIGPDFWRLVPVQSGDEAFLVFQYACELHDWLQKGSKAMLADALALGPAAPVAQGTLA